MYDIGSMADQRPVGKEKVAASLILLRVALLPGLSMDQGVLDGSCLSAAETSAAAGCSGGPATAAAATVGSSLSENTHAPIEITPHRKTGELQAGVCFAH